MTLIKLLVDSQGTDSLNEFLSENSLNSREEFHSTLIYAKETPMFIRPEFTNQIKTYLPLVINPETYKLDVFGGNLVLRYGSNLVRETQLTIIKQSFKHLIRAYDDLSGEEWDILGECLKQKRKSPIFSDFNPHITLAKQFHGESSNIGIPKIPLTFNRVYWKVFKPLELSPEITFSRE